MSNVLGPKRLFAATQQYVKTRGLSGSASGVGKTRRAIGMVDFKCPENASSRDSYEIGNTNFQGQIPQAKISAKHC
jgi:hypothetical protein